MFGSSWRNQYPSDELLLMAKKEWALALDGVEMKQIKAAFEQVKLSGSTFPPSLPMFLSYCREDKDWAHRGGAYRTFKRKCLPAPVDRSVGREALRSLRRVL